MTQFEYEPSEADDEAMVRAAMSDPEFADRELVTRFVAGELSPEDRTRFETRLRDDEDFRELAEPLIKVWKLIPRPDPEPDDEAKAEQSWQRIKELIELEERGFATPGELARRAARRRRWTVFFACFAILVAIAVWFVARDNSTFVSISLTGNPTTAVSNPRAMKLPDATRVTLAAGSQLSYPDWNARVNEHTVNLEGEGTFTIPRGPHQPLVVAGAGLEVKAFEGRFTIQAFNGQPIAYVKVHEGRLEVRARPTAGVGAVLTLRAGEGARVGPGERIERADVPIDAQTARSR